MDNRGHIIAEVSGSSPLPPTIEAGNNFIDLTLVMKTVGKLTGHTYNRS
jgi:hypothetical protein